MALFGLFRDFIGRTRGEDECRCRRLFVVGFFENCFKTEKNKWKIIIFDEMIVFWGCSGCWWFVSYTRCGAIVVDLICSLLWPLISHSSLIIIISTYIW
jgi:hypothetical protein